MLEVHAILQRQRCKENMTEKTGTLSDAYAIKKTVKFSFRQSVLIIDMSVGKKETFSVIYQQDVIGQNGKVQQHLVHLRITVSTDGHNFTGHRIKTFCNPLRIKSLRYPVPRTIIQDFIIIY